MGLIIGALWRATMALAAAAVLSVAFGGPAVLTVTVALIVGACLGIAWAVDGGLL